MERYIVSVLFIVNANISVREHCSSLHQGEKQTDTEMLLLTCIERIFYTCYIYVYIFSR